MAKKGSTKKSALVPLGDRVLIKPLSPEELEKKSASGIIIPDTAKKEKPEQGKVVAVGDGRRDESGNLIPVSVKKGDQVVFSKYGYDEVKFEDEEYYILREDQILAVIT